MYVLYIYIYIYIYKFLLWKIKPIIYVKQAALYIHKALLIQTKWNSKNMIQLIDLVNKSYSLFTRASYVLSIFEKEKKKKKRKKKNTKEKEKESAIMKIIKWRLN